MIFIKSTITYIRLKSKTYLKKIPVKTNNTLPLSYSSIYNLYRHSSKKLTGNICCHH